MTHDARVSRGTQPDLCRAVGRDAAAQRQAQAELAAAWARTAELSRLQSQFITNLNRDLRTPLNGLVGATELLAVTDLSDEQRECIKLLRASAEALTAVIEDIVDFSNIEAQQCDLADEAFDLPMLLSEVCGSAAAGASGGRLELRSSVDSDVPARLCGDVRLLRRVLINLVGNAVKFTPAGEVSVRVSRADDGGAADEVELLIAVSDTGIGVEPTAQRMIFKAFSAADASSTRRYGGTGLGLAVAKELVTLLRGDIGVDSAVGEGSTFWFTLPLRVSAPGTPAGGAAPVRHPDDPSEADASPHPRHVLVVEDDPTSQLVAVRLLQARGLDVDAVSSGRDALEALENASYDAIFMDCELPDLDGYEATREIRRREGSARHTPIIAMTASTMPGDAERCHAAGMDFYVPKPIRSAGLDYIIAHSIGS